MTHLFKSAVHLFLLRDNQVLLQRRFNTGYMDGYYSVIAGHLEGNETTYAAMIRETKEESGIDIRREHLTLVSAMHRKASDERIDFFFIATEWIGIPKICEPDKCDDLSWFDIDKLPSNIIPYVKQGLKNYQENKWFDTFGFS